MKSTFFFGFLLLFSNTIIGQELNLDVQITVPALKTADPKTLEILEGEIREFYNNTQWTDDDYDSDERIEGSLQINIKDDPSANSFVADFYWNVGRPVYNSNYSTPILNHVDKDVRFSYEQLTPLRDNRDNYTDNLSAVLTFYAYVILGYDGDTFAPLGGEDHFRSANQILNLVPPSASPNWTRQAGDRTRFWLMENMLDPRIKRYRQAIYNYHRKGLDMMHDDTSTGKAIILSSIKEIEEVSQAVRNSMVVQMWSNTKRLEVLEIFKNSVKSEQRRVFDLMASVDPGQVDLLKELR
ncbi:MAG: DUF4835 family protein [Bacteroidota bacterium]